MAQSAVNGARRGGVRRAEKQDRRRKRKAGQRAAAGAVAVAAATTLGFGQTVGAGHAEAVTIPNAVGSVGDVIGALANNGVTQGLADQWRLNLCSSDSDGGPVNGGADCSRSTGVGVAVVLPTTIDLVPDAAYSPAQGLFNAAKAAGLDFGTGKILGITVPVPDAALPEGSATVIGDGFQFALASGGGKATAISYLPLSLATAGASDGNTAFAFAIIGMANAWNTSDIPVEIFTVPTGISVPGAKHVSCYGVLTAGYASNVGACANVAGTFDARLDLQQSIPEFQTALTDPTAILVNPAEVLSDVLGQLFSGQPFSLSKDFTRLTVGGDRTDAYGLPVLFTLTSDYGTQAPIVVHWLGSSVTFNPTVTVNGEVKPNHLGLPVVTLGDVDTAQLLPTVDIPEIAFPFGVPSVGPFGGSSSAVSRSTASSSVSALRADASEAIAPADTPTETDTDTDTTAASSTADAPTATTETDTATQQVDAPSVPKSTAGAAQRDSRDSSASGYVGKHRSLDDYVGKHRSTDGTGSTAGAASNGVASAEGATDTTDTHTHDTGTSSESAHSTDNAASSQ
ncbi:MULTISPECIES: hypothetical protein [Gordonia]|uniref:hypothetical protein n=1 Tax=Gordonia TaxID=2053 RepID=UPI0007EA0C09|nr:MULTISPECIES: hypothetical protein [Gordonia]OBA40304.1 hypothetical protein A5766_23015 [Gordonia sp. 852002-51296_SCH5728562-b]